MDPSSKPSSVLRNRSTPVPSQLTPKSSTQLVSTVSQLSGTLLVNSRPSLLIQLILTLFPNLEPLQTQRTTTLLLLVGMDSSRSGLSLVNAKLQSELMTDQFTLLISTRTVSTLLPEERTVRLSSGSTLISRLQLRSGSSTRSSMMLRFPLLSTGLLLPLTLRFSSLITMLRRLLRSSLLPAKTSSIKRATMERKPNQSDTRPRTLPGTLNLFTFSLDATTVTLRFSRLTKLVKLTSK